MSGVMYGAEEGRFECGLTRIWLALKIPLRSTTLAQPEKKRDHLLVIAFFL